MHCKVEHDFCNNLHFLYVARKKRNDERSYERGTFPKTHTVIDSNDWEEMWCYLEHVSPQVVILAGHYPPLLLLGFLWAKLRKKHIAYWSDTNILDLQRKNRIKKNINLFWKRMFFSHVDTFFYIGTRNRDFYEVVIGRSKLENKLVKLPYPAIMPIVEGRVYTDHIRFLYLGRLDQVKCIDKLIHAFSLLSKEEIKSASLTIAGDGPERVRLEKLTEQLEVRNKIAFTGQISSDKVSEIYSKHDVFVLPSTYEPWGLVVNEALLAKLPVIAPYWVGATTDLIVDGYNGFIINNNKPKTIACTLQRVINTSKSDLMHMGGNGAEIVKAGGFYLNAAAQSLSSFLDNR